MVVIQPVFILLEEQQHYIFILVDHHQVHYLRNQVIMVDLYQSMHVMVQVEEQQIFGHHQRIGMKILIQESLLQVEVVVHLKI